MLVNPSYKVLNVWGGKGKEFSGFGNIFLQVADFSGLTAVFEIRTCYAVVAFGGVIPKALNMRWVTSNAGIE